MELHHKLRRDPNWHPSACNICGQMGHQAVNCTTGTINWRQIYGENAFHIKKPIFPSEEDEKKKALQVDLAALEQRARDYAKARSESLGVNYDEMTKKAAEMLAESEAAAGDKRPRDSSAAAEDEPAAKVAATEPGAAASEVKAEAPLPDGWASTKDAQGRTYFWHTKTKKVQWERPTADTPVQ